MYCTKLVTGRCNVQAQYNTEHVSVLKLVTVLLNSTYIPYSFIH